MKRRQPPGGKGGDEPGPVGTGASGKGVWPPDSVLVARDPLPDGTRDEIVENVGNLVRRWIPHADVRTWPKDGSVTKVGIWLTRAKGSSEGTDRDNGLAAVTLAPQFAFVLSLSPQTVYSIGDAIWKALPKRLDESGPNEKDPAIVLERFEIELVFPNIVAIDVHGAQTTAIDVGFDYHQTDLLFTENERIHSKREQSVDTDPGFLTPILKFLGDLPDSFPGAPNPGAMLADQLPTQFLLPGLDLKMVVQYESVSVSPDTGIVFQISEKLVPRKPRVRLSAPELHVRDETLHATATVHVEFEDFRAPKVSWSHPGGAPVAADASHLVVTYSLPQPSPKVVTHKVTATATDADLKGKKFHGNADVHIVVDKTKPDEGPHPPHTG